MKPFRILSIDGGGLRGVVPISILKKVEDITGKPLWQSFDLIAGTSTGGLIAAAATIPCAAGNVDSGAKYSLDDILNVYLHRGAEIFPPAKSHLDELFGKIDDTVNPRFSEEGIHRVFSDVCGNYRLNDALTELMICSYDLANNAPLFFKTRSSRKNPAQNILLYEACRATSAGPTYLPAFELYYPNDREIPQRLCIDGGVFINNPSLGALSEFSKHHSEYGYSPIGELSFNDVFVLSVGTGSYAGRITAEQAKHKGSLFWATRISDVMMRGVNRTTDYEMQEMMPAGNYVRLTIDIAKEEYAEMSRADSEAAEYLMNETRIQVLENEEKMESLTTFLMKAGLLQTMSGSV